MVHTPLATMSRYFRISTLALCFVTSLHTAYSQGIEDSLRAAIRQVNDPKALPGQYLSLAYALLKSAPDSTLTFAEKARTLAAAQGDSAAVARSYTIAAEAYQTKGELQSSTEHYWKAIAIAERHQNLKLLGSAYNGMGINYYLLNDMERAEKYILLAADAKLREGDFVYYAAVLTNLATLHFYKAQYKEALNILAGAARTLKQHDKEAYLPTIYNTLGAIYKQTNRSLDSAVYYYNLSIEVAVKHGLQDNIIAGYHNLGELYFHQKDYARAIGYLKKAEAALASSHTAKYKLGVYSMLSSAYKGLGDYKNALAYKEMHSQLFQETFQAEKQKAIDELQIKYETATKEQEIERQKQALTAARIQEERAETRLYFMLSVSVMVILTLVLVFGFLLHKRRTAALFEQEKLRMLENIVHDIRTPVTLISAPLEALRKTVGNHPAAATHFEIMERSTQRLIRLVNQLLDASKIDQGRYVVHFENGPLKPFIEQVTGVFNAELAERDITLRLNLGLPETPYSFCADVLEKVLGNLLLNAIKYCPEKSHIYIKATVENGQLLLTVQDNGPGIPGPERAKVFRRFYRRAEHRDLQGTGIGLAMVQELVLLAGGTLHLESAPGMGCRFHIALPVVQGTAFAKYPESTADEDQASPPAKLQLLFCDDDADMLTFVRTLLEADFEVRTARDGQEALDLIQAHAPDIVLADVLMPRLSGLELLRRVKADTILAHIPVVLLSGRASLESRLEGLRMGADAYMTKPFSPDELKLTLHNLTATLQKQKDDFVAKLQGELTFEERLKSTNAYVNKAIDLVIARISDPQYSVNELAADMCVSRSQLHRKLSHYTSFSTSNFIRMVRLEKAKDLLLHNEGNVTEVAYACGFSSQSYFTNSFTAHFGESPSKFLAQAKAAK